MDPGDFKLALKILAPDPKSAIRNFEKLLEEADIRASIEADYPRSETDAVFSERFVARLPGPIESTEPKHFVDLFKTLAGQETEHYVLFPSARFLQCLLAQECLLAQKHLRNSLRRRLAKNHLKWLTYHRLRIYRIAGRIVIPVETVGVYAIVEGQRIKSEARSRKQRERTREGLATRTA